METKETKEIKVREPLQKGKVKLMKFFYGKWRVVDIGLASKAEAYNCQGYIVEY